LNYIRAEPLAELLCKSDSVARELNVLINSIPDLGSMGADQRRTTKE
jgi:hypothetical protein